MKLPVDKHSEPQRINAGFAVIYCDEAEPRGHAEGGIRMLDQDACPNRSRCIDEFLLKLRQDKPAPHAPAVLESTEEKIG